MLSCSRLSPGRGEVAGALWVPRGPREAPQQDAVLPPRQGGQRGGALILSERERRSVVSDSL